MPMSNGSMETTLECCCCCCCCAEGPLEPYDGCCCIGTPSLERLDVAAACRPSFHRRAQASVITPREGFDFAVHDTDDDGMMTSNTAINDVPEQRPRASSSSVVSCPRRRVWTEVTPPRRRPQIGPQSQRRPIDGIAISPACDKVAQLRVERYDPYRSMQATKGVAMHAKDGQVDVAKCLTR